MRRVQGIRGTVRWEDRGLGSGRVVVTGGYVGRCKFSSAVEVRQFLLVSCNVFDILGAMTVRGLFGFSVREEKKTVGGS